MPRRKTDNKYKKVLDGRNNNGQKKGDKQLRAIQKELKSLDSSNKAKKDRITAQANSGIREVYGSEAEFWKFVAEQSKDSFNHLKFLSEYAFGKPGDNIGSSVNTKTDVPIINFFAGTQNDKLEDTIDITPEEDDN